MLFCIFFINIAAILAAFLFTRGLGCYLRLTFITVLCVCLHVFIIRCRVRCIVLPT
jgi:hypothetical protein